MPGHKFPSWQRLKVSGSSEPDGVWQLIPPMQIHKMTGERWGAQECKVLRHWRDEETRERGRPAQSPARVLGGQAHSR